MDRSPLSGSELMQVETSPPPKMEIIREISFPTVHNTTRPGRLSESSFEDGDKALTSELTNFLG